MAQEVEQEFRRNKTPDVGCGMISTMCHFCSKSGTGQKAGARRGGTSASYPGMGTLGTFGDNWGQKYPLLSRIFESQRFLLLPQKVQKNFIISYSMDVSRSESLATFTTDFTITFVKSNEFL